MTEAAAPRRRAEERRTEDIAARAPVDRIAERLLDTRIGRVWGRYAPLGAGAVGSAAIVVAGAEGLRRLLRPGRRGRLVWLGVLALVPVALGLLPRRLDAPGPEREEVSGSG